MHSQLRTAKLASYAVEKAVQQSAATTATNTTVLT